MDKDVFAFSGSCFHVASVSSMDIKKVFTDSSKATRLADPGIAQAAILKTQLKFLKTQFIAPWRPCVICYWLLSS